MPKLLENLSIDEISLVLKNSRPANQGARILLTKIDRDFKKTEEEETTMSLKQEYALIQKLEVQLKYSTGTVRKSENLSQEAAQELVEDFAKFIRTQEPELSDAQAYVKAMEEIPTIAALAVGKSLEWARGSY